MDYQIALASAKDISGDESSEGKCKWSFNKNLDSNASRHFSPCSWKPKEKKETKQKSFAR